MSYRQWYAQLDVFDTIRRYTALLSRWTTDAPNRERLFVADFYLVNPPLLHKTQMTSAARKAFNSLGVPKPENTFVQLPSPTLLYNKMAGIQSEALHNLIGRGLCEVDAADKGIYRLSGEGIKFSVGLAQSLVLPREEGVLRFLTNEFSTVGIGKGGLRAATGLRRIGV
ncbi:hypothetical protein GR217_22850 [Rhizobium leguminosarum]|uniref:Uncharacterized protein n=1 Tax=Rhizobium ruizarguesonis TaxID=2081791 RepID=A0AAE4YVH5_9HYPH|nr:ABC-three component system middle component 5 [Rhizobium ruizarguesonis]NEI50527.1 hypothetical protein [Rhizobium ruizarguesonis]